MPIPDHLPGYADSLDTLLDTSGRRPCWDSLTGRCAHIANAPGWSPWLRRKRAGERARRAIAKGRLKERMMMGGKS